MASSLNEKEMRNYHVLSDSFTWIENCAFYFYSFLFSSKGWKRLTNPFVSPRFKCKMRRNIHYLILSWHKCQVYYVFQIHKCAAVIYLFQCVRSHFHAESCLEILRHIFFFCAHPCLVQHQHLFQQELQWITYWNAFPFWLKTQLCASLLLHGASNLKPKPKWNFWGNHFAESFSSCISKNKSIV